MAACPSSNAETYVIKGGKLILKVNPISWIPQDKNNICNEGNTSGNGDEISNEGNKNGDDHTNDDPKHNNDVANTITPTKETELPSSAKKTRKRRRCKVFPTEWINNWEIKERPRNDGRIDKYFRHKNGNITLRSIKSVVKYENGELPDHEIKNGEEKETIDAEKDVQENLKKKKEDGEEKETIDAEKEVQENLAKKKKEDGENMQIYVEKFLAEAHYNLIHGLF